MVRGEGEFAESSILGESLRSEVSKWEEADGICGENGWLTGAAGERTGNEFDFLRSRSDLLLPCMAKRGKRRRRK